MKKILLLAGLILVALILSACATGERWSESQVVTFNLVTGDPATIKELCKVSGGIGCYKPRTNTVYTPIGYGEAFDNEVFGHEVNHAREHKKIMRKPLCSLQDFSGLVLCVSPGYIRKAP